MRRSVGLLRLGLVSLMTALAAPSGLEAQSLDESELQYRAALTAYDAAARSRDVLGSRFLALLDSLTTARNANDDDRVDSLEGRFRDIGVEYSRVESRVDELEQEYETARAALLSALDQRLDSLGVVAEMAADPARRDSIGAVIFDLQIQFAQVNAEVLEETIGPRSMVLPAFRPNPRDTPATLRAKAEFLRDKAEEFQREIDRVDQLLERYRGELRLAQFTGDARASIDRFGDTQVPVRGSGGATRTDQGIVADTAGVDLEALPPEDAIVRLEQARVTLVLARDQTLGAAEDIRNRIGAGLEQERDR